MQLAVTRRHRAKSGALTGVLAALGFGAGLASGFLLGSLFGAGGHRRVGRLVRASRQPSAPERRAALIDRVRHALAADPVVGKETFELLAIGQKGIALHGWVASREARARAYRIARTEAGTEPVINRLLVHGEDDAGVLLVRDDAPRSA